MLTFDLTRRQSGHVPLSCTCPDNAAMPLLHYKKQQRCSRHALSVWCEGRASNCLQNDFLKTDTQPEQYNVLPRTADHRKMVFASWRILVLNVGNVMRVVGVKNGFIITWATTRSHHMQGDHHIYIATALCNESEGWCSPSNILHTPL